MQELYSKLREQMFNLQKDVTSASSGTKTAARRVRKEAREIEKGLKELRKLSSAITGKKEEAASVGLNLTPAA